MQTFMGAGLGDHDGSLKDSPFVVLSSLFWGSRSMTGFGYAELDTLILGRVS